VYHEHASWRHAATSAYGGFPPIHAENGFGGSSPSQESRLQIGDPQPGALDLGINYGDQVVVPCELQLHDIDWGLYDVLKVVSLFRADKPAAAAYLVTGGTESEWTNSGLGAYFEPGVRPAAPNRSAFHPSEGSRLPVLQYLPRSVR